MPEREAVGFYKKWDIKTKGVPLKKRTVARKYRVSVHPYDDTVRKRERSKKAAGLHQKSQLKEALFSAVRNIILLIEK